MLQILLSSPPKLFLIGLGLLGAIYVCVCLVLVLQQSRMIFFPTPLLEATPADVGLAYEEVWIPVFGDRPSEKIHGWWIPSPQPDAGVMLQLHGNGYNIGANITQAAFLHQLGFSVLLIDYRGYGQSPGRFPSEIQVYQDAEAGWRHLVQDRQIVPDQIFIFGHSLGGAIAIDLALQHPAAAGLFVESSFTSMLDMATRTKQLGMFPVRWLLNQRFESIQKVRSLQLPVMFIHGDADLAVPSDMSQQLYEAASEPKQLLLVPMAGHNNVSEVGGMQYRQAIQEFIGHCKESMLRVQP